MKLWEHPNSYAGATWEGWCMSLGQHRDSDTVERSNFQVAVSMLDAGRWTEELETHIVRENHGAVGWVEWIAVHPSDPVALWEACSIEARLENYSILDEEHLSILESDEAAEAWANASVADRLELIQENNCGTKQNSIFAARRAELPERDDQGRIQDRLLGR